MAVSPKLKGFRTSDLFHWLEFESKAIPILKVILRQPSHLFPHLVMLYSLVARYIMKYGSIADFLKGFPQTLKEVFGFRAGSTFDRCARYK